MVPSVLFSGLPQTLADELIKALERIEANFRERRWEPSELNGGKLCEVAYTILRGHVDGKFPAKASKPRNMVDACRALEKAGAHFPRSVRIQVPRMIIALYEIRNNRGVGHVGGDVEPNEMDATCVLQMAKWIVAELIRILHATTTERATEIVSALSGREIAMIWRVDGVARVLDSSLSAKSQTLLLLYSATGGMDEKDLVAAIEPSKASNYRRDVLRPAHKARLIEYNEAKRTAKISPAGAKLVEDQLLKTGSCD
ncbi:MAG: hypothetical protein AAFV36_08935 [Myxococcota bacterium]